MIEVTRITWNKVMDTDETVLIDIYSPTCVPCKMLYRVLEEMDGDGEVDLPTVTVMADEVAHIPQLNSLGISSVPTLVVMINRELYMLPKSFQQEVILKNIKALEEEHHE